MNDAFQPYTVAIDSDGCAFDNMTIKHRQCFGPALVKTWRLESVAEAVQYRWDQINLFSASRGINRFLALLIFWNEVPDRDLPLGFIRPDTTRMKRLAEDHASLSPPKIKDALQQREDEFMEMALSWSNCVNANVAQMDYCIGPFSGVAEVLAKCVSFANVYVVSSANRETIIDEWKKAGLAQWVRDFITQEHCSKKDFLCTQIFAARATLMIGDSPGDWYAAVESRAYFYPIIPGEEQESWHALEAVIDTAHPELLIQAFPDQVNRFKSQLQLS